jgi:signal transduction histidine kinase
VTQAALELPRIGGWVERALGRVGVHDHVSRIVAATPSLRGSWIAASAATAGFSAWAGQAGPKGVFAFLIVAPLVPLAGVAAAYGPWMDPMHEMAHATPTSGMSVLLLRSAAVLVSTSLIIGVAAAFLPGANWTTAAWVLPSLSLTLASIALSTFVSTQWAAAAVTSLWFTVILVVAVRSDDRFAAFRGPGQVAFFIVVVGSAAVLARRRERLDIQGRAQQRRLVDVAENERRRIERNIHDGAQQQLVAISVKLGLAKSLVKTDPSRAVALIEDLQTDAQEALDSLREMVRGTSPPILADHGLGTALEAQVRRSPFPVAVSADSLGRFATEVETAAYFCCLEALQNAAKYARASHGTVALRCVGRELAFTVIDDGTGFDPETVRRGVGLRSMHERLAALGGSLSVRSAPGAGTTIVGRIPVEAAP